MWFQQALTKNARVSGIALVVTDVKQVIEFSAPASLVLVLVGWATDLGRLEGALSVWVVWTLVSAAICMGRAPDDTVLTCMTL